jgi:hypothetical protein
MRRRPFRNPLTPLGMMMVLTVLIGFLSAALAVSIMRLP